MIIISGMNEFPKPLKIPTFEIFSGSNAPALEPIRDAPASLL